MKVIGYLIAGFLCLAFVPIAFPVLIIVAIVHMLDGKKKSRQKDIIVEALKEAGVNSQATQHKDQTKKPLSFGAYLGIVIAVLVVLKAITPSSPSKEDNQAPKVTAVREVSATARANVAAANNPNAGLQNNGTMSAAAARTSSSSVSGTAKTYNAVQICSAAIAAIMGRPLDIMKARQGKDGIINVSYVRPQDSKTFEYGCKVAGDKVIWRAKLDGQWGRWRDSAADAVVKYRGGANGLTIFEGSADTTYPASKF